MANSDHRRSTDKSQSKRKKGRRNLDWTSARLLALGEDLRKTRALESTLQAVTRVSVELTRSVQSTLRLLDESGKRLLTSARSGPSVHRRGSPPFQFGEGFLGWVVVHRRADFTNHPARDPRFVYRKQLWTPAAVMAVPLLSTHDCIGVLSVSRKTRTPYTRLDLKLLQLVGHLSEPHLEIARLKRLNESDPLTLLHNRRHLDDRLPLEIQRTRRTKSTLAAAMVDIDHFKRVNDSYGHDVGDEVLTEFAERLRQESRSSDVMVRWGGEEFLALFPETNRKQAQRIAERIRTGIERNPFSTSAGKLFLTASIGMAVLKRQDDAHSLVQRADRALYKAKRQGRNRVEWDPRNSSRKSC